MFGFFPLGLCRRQPRNRQIHRQVCWKRHRISGVVGKQRNIGFVGFLGNVEQKWCRKYRKWLRCEIFVTKSKLKASLAVWRNLLSYIFQWGLQPGSPSRLAAPGIWHKTSLLVATASEHACMARLQRAMIVSVSVIAPQNNVHCFVSGQAKTRRHQGRLV